MDDSSRLQLELELEHSCRKEEDDAKDDLEFYETIEAPKFVDFTRPNHFCPDDRYWFCSRLGCNQKHEEELDSEAIYKDFVIRVMAARSPNVRFQRALTRKSPSDSKKYPMSAPPKSSKSRIPRLALVSSVSKQLMCDTNVEKSTIEIAPLNPAPKPRTTRVKHVPAKYMAFPRKKKGSLPKPNAVQNVKNSEKTSSIILQKNNKVVAKALTFGSPKKAVKAKTSESTTPVTKLCEGVKKLAITSQKKGITQKPSDRQLLPFDTSRKQLSAPCKAKTRKENPSCSIMVKKHETKTAKSRTEEKSDGSSSNMESNVSVEEPTSSSERHLTAGSSDWTSSTTLDSIAFQEPNPTCHNKGSKDKKTEDDLENQDPGFAVEIVDNDDKENAVNTNNIRNVDRNILSKQTAPATSKGKRIHKIQNGDMKSVKENCPVVITKEVKYKKLKPTNPKPFRLRTDERGILKEANLGKKVNSRENSAVTSENLQHPESGVSAATREKACKKVEDKTLKKIPVKSIYKKTPNEAAVMSGTGKCPSYKQPLQAQRKTESQAKPKGSTQTTMTKLKTRGTKTAT